MPKAQTIITLDTAKRNSGLPMNKCTRVPTARSFTLLSLNLQRPKKQKTKFQAITSLVHFSIFNYGKDTYKDR